MQGADSAASLQVQATNSSGGTLSFSATGLPPGLSINTATGLISGTLAAGAGSNTPYQTTVTASDGTYSGSTNIAWYAAAPVVNGAVTLYNPGTQTGTKGTAASLQIRRPTAAESLPPTPPGACRRG
jgi:hypothetical protein